MNLDLEQLVQQVVRQTTDVAGFIQKEASHFTKKDIELKGKNNLVSYVDKESERLLVEGLGALLPEAGFIAEEGSGVPQENGLNWIIDPLDGTTNFIHGIPTYAISIALCKGKEPLLGVVYEVGRNECFWATQGGGAFMNGKLLGVSDTSVFSEALVATGFPYEKFEKIEAYMQLLASMMQNCHGLRRIGSAAVDLAYVAAGRFEGFFEYNLNSWDVAAGSLIVVEAGGEVSDFRGQDNHIFGKQILATNGILQAKMLKIIQETFQL
ncbi:MAG: inositol monophosphatase [Bernardetiaceae bacterium]|nr:inositol monophosphatase [Bernardetiaceae bacterium]